MSRFAFRAAILSAAVALAAVPAFAQSSLGIGNAEVAVQPGGSGALFVWIAGVQREFFTSLREALVAMRNGSAGYSWLVGLSFAYGVFHAAGPGHGKAVISSYMLANEVELRRGVFLSFASALLQALSALLLVGAGWYLLRGTAVSMTDAAFALEVGSYALVAVFGGWLLARKLVAVVRRRTAASSAPAPSGGLAFAAAGTFSQDRGGSTAIGRNSSRIGPGAASAAMDREICVADDDCSCGRQHIVDPRKLGGTRLGWRNGLSAAFAVGLRPCSGAIVVLTFSLMNGLYAAGVLSVLAMALGTAITVSVLATMAVLAKDLALRFGGGRRSLVIEALEIVGAGLFLALGLTLLGGALSF